MRRLLAVLLILAAAGTCGPTAASANMHTDGRSTR